MFEELRQTRPARQTEHISGMDERLLGMQRSGAERGAAASSLAQPSPPSPRLGTLGRASMLASRLLASGFSGPGRDAGGGLAKEPDSVEAAGDNATELRTHSSAV